MLKLLREKKIFSWCLFDFGISSYPTLILTFFYGAFYAKNIAISPVIGASNWGLAISVASILSFLFLSFIFMQGKIFCKYLSVNFFKFFFYILVISTSCLFFFDQNTNQYLPLVLIILSFICFEILTLFYNVTLHRISEDKHGTLSNLGWAFGYFGGLLSLLLIFLLIKYSSSSEFTILSYSSFLFIGPVVGLWIFIFGLSHLRNSSLAKFKIPDIVSFYQNIKNRKLGRFLFSYFFLNNGVICIFAFASMFASFIFGFSELEILYLGIFINLSGMFGCLIMGNFEKKIGSEKNVMICSSVLFILTLILFFIRDVFFFWIIALFIGFFIGPIQASSRAVLSINIKKINQLAAFSFYSILGNICAILGPFIISLIIDVNESIRFGILVIPIFFFISLLPYFRPNA